MRTSFRIETSREGAGAFERLQVAVRSYIRADVQVARPEGVQRAQCRRPDDPRDPGGRHREKARLTIDLVVTPGGTAGRAGEDRLDAERAGVVGRTGRRGADQFGPHRDGGARAAGAGRLQSASRCLSQDIARTPIRLRQQTAPDTYEDARDHPLYELLHDLPNPELTSLSVLARADVAAPALWPRLCGNRPRRRPHRGPLAARDAAMRVDRDEQRRKRWTYSRGGTPVTWLFDPSQPPILELTMPTPITHCREAIGSALALQAYVGKFFANEARPGGVLQAPGAISDDGRQPPASALEEHLRRRRRNRRGVAVLDQGLEFKAIQRRTTKRR